MLGVQPFSRQCRSHSICVTPWRHGLTSREGNLVVCTVHSLTTQPQVTAPIQNLSNMDVDHCLCETDGYACEPDSENTARGYKWLRIQSSGEPEGPPLFFVVLMFPTCAALPSLQPVDRTEIGLYNTILTCTGLEGLKLLGWSPTNSQRVLFSTGKGLRVKGKRAFSPKRQREAHTPHPSATRSPPCKIKILMISPRARRGHGSIDPMKALRIDSYIRSPLQNTIKWTWPQRSLARHQDPFFSADLNRVYFRSFPP